MIRQNKQISSNNGQLLSLILEKTNISQRVCSINMGENDAFLTNFIYRSPENFGRDFSYRFLSSVYHFLVRDSLKRSNEKFDEIINNQEIVNLGINNKLLIPALQRHILALINIKSEIFEKKDEEIVENYLQEIYPETFEGYKNFLKGLDYERTGLKNLQNVQQLYEQEHQNTLENILSDSEIDSLNEYSDFEIQLESANNFYYICENLRSKLLPSFLSPTDFKEAEMPYFNKGNFLIKRSIINNLKKSNIVGGEVIIKSGQFNFEPKKEKEQQQKISWYYGKSKTKREIEEHNEELRQLGLDKTNFEKVFKTDIEKKYAEITLQQENLDKKIKLTLEENEKLKKELLKHKKISLNPNKENEQNKLIEQGKDVRKLYKKGKKVTLVDIDWLINKHGNTKIIRDFVNKLGLFKLDSPESEKIPDLFEDSEKIDLLNEEKKLA